MIEGVQMYLDKASILHIDISSQNTKKSVKKKLVRKNSTKNINNDEKGSYLQILRD